MPQSAQSDGSPHREGMIQMKHKVTVKVETKKHFLGIPYHVTEKKRIEVDGKTYRKMKRDEQERQQRKRELDQELLAAGEYLMWEEELADLLDR